jgi:sugar/nucleoside kinase (ribokinase family)
VILVFGAICIDRLRRVPHLPERGGYVEVQEETWMLGGEAANTANALGSWGNAVTLTGNRLGTDPESAVLRRMLDAKGLVPRGDDPEFEPPAPTPICDVYITPDGDRTMFGRGFAAMGPMLELDATPFQPGAWFTAEPNMSDPARRVAAEALQRGMRRYLMDFFRDEEALDPSDFWQCSSDWVGVRGNTQKNVEWVREWVARYGCFTLLSDGPNGFVAGSPAHPVRAYPPFPAPAVVDTTGAGDLFRAGMLHGLTRGWPLPECLRFASAAGCLKCQFLGATGHVPSEEQIRRHIASNPEVAVAYG